MFNFMKKERTEEERAERERRKSEKREKKKNSKRAVLSHEELERLEEVRRSLRIKGNLSPRKQSTDEADRASVVGLRYSQIPGSDGPSPDTSDTASTWSNTGSIGSLGRPARSILKSKPTTGASQARDLDDLNLLMKNTKANELYLYKSQESETSNLSNRNSQTKIESAPVHGECLGSRARPLLATFPLRLPEIAVVVSCESAPPLSAASLTQVKLQSTDAWRAESSSNRRLSYAVTAKNPWLPHCAIRHHFRICQDLEMWL